MSNPTDYTIAWICAIPVENVAAEEFLDEEHEPPIGLAARDTNTYKLGRMGKHNIVILSLPLGLYDNGSVTSVANNLVHSFPNIRFSLIVGVGSGCPNSINDIRLGDVVVSVPKRGRSNIILQYDYGKDFAGQPFQHTSPSHLPPTILLTALQRLISQYVRKGHNIEQRVAGIIEKNPRLQFHYHRPTIDRLYKSHIVHPAYIQGDCGVLCGDDNETLILREERSKYEDNPKIHYGAMASGTQHIWNAQVRDQLTERQNILCFEIGAAGLMNVLPCLVIRGICDYADSHRNEDWQGYAAMTAAAYANDLLTYIQPTPSGVQKTALLAMPDIGKEVKIPRTGFQQVISDPKTASTVADFMIWTKLLGQLRAVQKEQVEPLESDNGEIQERAVAEDRGV